MKYDFHVHTSRYSPCAVSSPEAMCREALRRGLNGIALTEHDILWPWAEYQELCRGFPELAIFLGLEYAVPEGHFLVFLPDPGKGLPYVSDLAGLRAAVCRLGGVLVWAHPFRYHRTQPPWLARIHLDAMEVASTNMSPPVQAIARQTAARWHIPTLVNSDAHHTRSLGTYYNDIPLKLRHNRDLVDFVKSLGRPEPATLRPGSAPRL
ncbi:MAG: PHP domain-containing protein [Deltaproteobacteria bacterium]|nr:PHP domain-containing protein [Deltaproteobacteria bacterium]